MFKFLSELLLPEDAKAGGTITEPMDKTDVIKFLGEDDKDEVIELEDDKEDKEDKEDKGEDKEDKEDEVDELKEIEEEVEEPSEEKLELIAPVKRREILARYPKLFKEFPYLEKAYYREQKFTEIFPTPSEAEDAKEQAEILGKFSNDLMNGNTERMLLAAKSNPKSFAKLIDNYLPTLAKVDENAYLHIVGNVAKQTIMEMVREAKETGDSDLQEAARILNKFIFRTEKFTPPSKLAADEKEEDKDNSIEEQKRQFLQQRFDSTKEELGSKVENSFKATIEANIDPRGSMTAYVKKNAGREAFESLKELISSDDRFKVTLDKLWEKAIESNFNKESTDRIRSAYIHKAKTLLPAVIKKAREEAMRGMVRAKKEEATDKEEVLDTKPNRTRQDTKEQSRSNKGDKNKIPEGMSTFDYLMQDDD